jgi:putative membrane protein
VPATAAQASTPAQPVSSINKEQLVNSANWGPIANSIIFSLIGVLIYVVGFIVLDKVTPYHLWREINEKQNVALAILVGSIAIGLALIVAAAIHG